MQNKNKNIVRTHEKITNFPIKTGFSEVANTDAMSFAVAIRISAFFKQRSALSNGFHVVPKSHFISLLGDVLGDLRQLGKAQASKLSKNVVAHETWIDNGWHFLFSYFNH